MGKTRLSRATGDFGVNVILGHQGELVGQPQATTEALCEPTLV
jgi:hypothetical protein